DASAGKLLFAVGADVGEEQVAEDHVGDAIAHGGCDRLAHPRLIDFVRAGIGYRHNPLRQAGRLALCAQDFLAHAVNGHPLERLCYGGQRAHHVELAGAARLMQRKCAVLAAGPGDQRSRLWHQLTDAPDRPARGGPPDCRRFTAGACFAGSSRKAPIRFSAASAARSPLSQAPSTVPHSVSWTASPAKKSAPPSASVKIFRDGWPPGEAADIAPST